MPENDLQHEIALLNKAVFGDRENPKDSPGVIVEQADIRTALARTNEILTELRNAVLWINGLLITGFITGIIAVVLKIT